jgi:hypothetical protein
MQNTPRTHARKTEPPCKRQRDARTKAHTEAARKPAQGERITQGECIAKGAHVTQGARITTHPDPAPACSLPSPHKAPRAYRAASRQAGPRACVQGLFVLGVLAMLGGCAQDEPITSERIARELAASPQLRREVAQRLLEDRALVRAVALVVVTEYHEQLRGEQGPQGEAGPQGAQGPEGARGPQGLAGLRGQEPAASYCTRLCGEGMEDGSGSVCKGGRWVSARDLCASDEDCPQNQTSPFGLRWACVEGVCERAACSTDNQCGALEVCRTYSLAPSSLQAH